jgi:hypothetical protein
MMPNGEETVDWSGVIARCLAYLCLKNSEVSGATILERAKFLEKLGLPVDDQAAMLGSTSDSLKALARQARAKAKRKAKQ